MIPANFPQVNMIFTKPDGLSDEECGSLPAYVGDASDGTPCIVSCWSLSPEELDQIQETGTIWLSVVGNQMPPVALFSDNPFGDV